MGNERVKRVIAQLVAAFPHAKITEQTIVVYIRLLSDIPVEDLQVVVDQSIAECKFMPTVAEIRDRYRMLTIGLGQGTSAEAWGQVVDEIRRIGSYGTPEFDDALTAETVRQMGWRELCMSEKPDVVRAQFMRMYDSLAARRDQVDKLVPTARRLAADRVGMSHVGKLLEANDGSGS